MLKDIRSPFQYKKIPIDQKDHSKKERKQRMPKGR